MAESATIANLIIGLTARTDKLERDLKAARGKLDSFKKGADSVGAAMSRMNNIMGAFGLSIGLQQTIGFLKESAAAFDESVKASMKLQAVMDSTGNRVGFTTDQISDYADSLQRMTGVSDETIKSSAALLATFKGISGVNFRRALEAAANMAAVTGVDMEGAARTIGMALIDPSKGIGKLGARFSKDEIEAIKAMAEAGNMMGAQDAILDRLAESFGNAAAEMKTGADDMRVAIDELKESIGSLFDAVGGNDTLKQLAAGTLIASDTIRGISGDVKSGNFGGAAAGVNSLTPLGMLTDLLMAKLGLVGPAKGAASNMLPKRVEEVDLGAVGRAGGGAGGVQSLFAPLSKALFKEFTSAERQRMDDDFKRSQSRLQDSVTMREFTGRERQAAPDRPAALLRGTAAAFSASFGQKARPVEEKMLHQQKEQVRVLKNIEAQRAQAELVNIGNV